MAQPHRRSIRLKGYDYSGAGAYFVTIVAIGRECLFGEIIDGAVRLNDIGRRVEDEWLRTPQVRTQVGLDACVVMPNHFHGIFFIPDRSAGVSQYAPTGPAFRSPSHTVGATVRGFKSAATKRVNAIRGTLGLPVWQRNYYEHVVRNEKDLRILREYIAGNPAQWASDQENPFATPVPPRPTSSNP